MRSESKDSPGIKRAICFLVWGIIPYADGSEAEASQVNRTEPVESRSVHQTYVSNLNPDRRSEVVVKLAFCGLAAHSVLIIESERINKTLESDNR